MTDQEIEQLFNDNIDQLNRLYVDAGTAVKTLLSELQRAGRHTYIRLKNAEENGHTVEYEFVEGDQTKVAAYAEKLGFKTVTDTILEVYSE